MSRKTAYKCFGVSNLAGAFAASGVQAHGVLSHGVAEVGLASFSVQDGSRYFVEVVSKCCESACCGKKNSIEKRFYDSFMHVISNNEGSRKFKTINANLFYHAK